MICNILQIISLIIVEKNNCFIHMSGEWRPKLNRGCRLPLTLKININQSLRPKFYKKGECAINILCHNNLQTVFHIQYSHCINSLADTMTGANLNCQLPEPIEHFWSKIRKGPITICKQTLVSLFSRKAYAAHANQPHHRVGECLLYTMMVLVCVGGLGFAREAFVYKC